MQRDIQRVIVGSALVLAASAVLPIAQKTIRPIVRDLSRQMKFLMVSAKEEIEDIVAEVKFERMKQQLSEQNLIECEVEIVSDRESRILH